MTTENKAPPLKLEAGKFYKTRSGGKAFVAAIRNESYIKCGAIGWIEGDPSAKSWNLSGPFHSDGTPSCFDLIEEWKEPVKVRVEGWINVYPIGTTSLYSTKERADLCAAPDRIACIEVNREVVQGDGL